MNAIKILVKGWVKVLPFYLFALLPLLMSCSSETETQEEFGNWQERNESVLQSWAANSSMKKILTYTKDQNTLGKSSDYIYVEVLETGSGTESPIYNDTCRVAYRGRLIPSETYTDGYRFDETYIGDFDWRTCSTADFSVDYQLCDGFATALQNMHVGDRWRVHFSYTLGYGVSTLGSIPGYSNLIFDIALVDFWHPGESRPTFRAREK